MTSPPTKPRPANPHGLAGECEGGKCMPAVRCTKHACLYAKKTMEDQGWVCVNEYGAEAAQRVDDTFLMTLQAIHAAGVEMQRWMAGWDEKKGTPIMGVWAPRAAAAILNAMAGRTRSPAALTAALREAKVNGDFAGAVDAAWRMGGAEAAIQIIQAELPHVASEINLTVRGA